MTTVPGYLPASSINEGPNVKFKGPEKVFSYPGYSTYAESEGSYIARSLPQILEKFFITTT